MGLENYVGKYGVLNDEFKKNTTNTGNKYHKYSDGLVQVMGAKEGYAFPLSVLVGGDTFKIETNEINLLEDTDPIIKLKVGERYDHYFGSAIIQMIDYKNRKMQLKYDDNSSEVVDVPKVKQTPIREIPVISHNEEIFRTTANATRIMNQIGLSIGNKEVVIPDVVVVDEDMVIHKQLLEKLHEVIKAKRSDYGDSFGKQYDEYGILSALIRLEDKLNRLKSLTVGAKTQQVNDESIYDTALDLIGYGSLLLVKLEKEKQNVS